MRLIDADALIPTQVHTVVVVKDGREQLESVLYAEQVDDAPTVEPASPWHRVEEKPKEGTWCVIAKHSYLQPHNLFYDIAHYLHGTFSVYDSGVGDWFDGKPLYWMPIEPPKEEEHGN